MDWLAFYGSDKNSYHKHSKRGVSKINEHRIERFFSQIKSTQSEAESLGRKFFTRILIISLLDNLSRCAYPRINGNRKRFVKLIDQYANWDLSTHYSLRQLYFRLSDVTNPQEYPGYQDLFDSIQTRMNAWPGPGTIVYAKGIDPSISDLSSLLSNELQVLIEPVRYPCLVWNLRNYVIHEGRNPGEGMDLELGDATPYYHQLTHIDRLQNEKQTWELYIPNDLISDLLTKCINTLKSNFLNEDTDPWLAFPSHSNWY